MGIFELTLKIVNDKCINYRCSTSYMSLPSRRNKDGKDLLHCPTTGCDGLGHISGNYSTHRRYIEYIIQDISSNDKRDVILQWKIIDSILLKHKYCKDHGVVKY